MSLLLPPQPPMGSTSHAAHGHGHNQQPHISSTFLRDLQANPLRFGDSVGRASFAPKAGLREVFPGPPSPPRSLLRLEPIAKANGAELEEGEVDEDEEEEREVRRAGVEGKKSPERVKVGTKGNKEVAEKENVKGETVDMAKAQRPVLGPSTPPHLRQKDTSVTAVTPASTAKPSVLPPTATLTKKANGHLPVAGPSTTPTASSSTTPAPAKTNASSRSLHAPIPDEALRFTKPLENVSRKAAGLWNPSMACYANATLQVMMHTPPFVREMYGHLSGDCRLSQSNKFCLLCVMREMLQEHWTKKAHNPKAIHAQLGVIKKGFSKNRQEDTHEFFRFACDALQNTALAGLGKNLPEDVKHTTWVHRLWGGRVRSRVVCSKCMKPSDTFDHFLDLSLDCGADKRTLTAMLQGFIKDDKLDGDNKYHCESCKGKANATKSFRIAEAPPVLTLHLKRFSMNYNSWNGKARADKYNQHIGFEEYLDIAPYMVDRNETVGPNTKYRLFGVTCHRGAELRFGHYTAYVRAPNGCWYQADDEDMTPSSLSDVKNDKTAYLLSYIRLAEGEEIPAGARISGHANGYGNGNGVAVNGESSAMAGKRKRAEAEENEMEARRRAKNAPGSGRLAQTQTQTQGDAMKQPIKRIVPTNPTTPLFPSVHDNQPQSNGHTPVRPNGNYVPRQTHLPSPAPSDRTAEDDDDDSSRMTQFGASMNGNSRPTPNSNSGLAAPRPIPSASFYGSPITRTSHPGPDSPRKGKKSKKNRKQKAQGNSSPYNAGGGGGGGKVKGGFANKKQGVYDRMKK